MKALKHAGAKNCKVLGIWTIFLYHLPVVSYLCKRPVQFLQLRHAKKKIQISYHSLLMFYNPQFLSVNSTGIPCKPNPHVSVNINHHSCREFFFPSRFWQSFVAFGCHCNGNKYFKGGVNYKNLLEKF
ncbi:hypothetical protein GQX74_004828 [Glossina fuscipes]|nr:hypothetical protein GQX74_004828 [Glossina fuscipes]